MNSQYNNQFHSNLKSASGKLLLPFLGFLLVLFSPFVANDLINYFIPAQQKPDLVNPQDNKIPQNDEQFDKMIERNHHIHDMVQKEVSDNLNFIWTVLIGSIGILIFAGKHLIDSEVKQDIEKEKKDYQEQVMYFVSDTSKLMTLLSLTNDEQIISNSLNFPPQIKTYSEDLNKLIENINAKFPANEISHYFNVKLGDLQYSLAKYYDLEADNKKNKHIQEKANSQYKQALEAYEQAIQKEPDIHGFASIFWSQTYCKLGNVFTALKRYAEADMMYVESLKLMPVYYWAYHSQGDLLAKQERYKEAIEKYDKALKICPNNAESLYKKGIAIASQNKNNKDKKNFIKEEKQAIECYKKALYYTHENGWILHSYADSLNKIWFWQKDELKLNNDEFKVCSKYEQASKFTQYKSLLCWGNSLLKSGYFLERITRQKAKAKFKRQVAMEKYQQALEIAEEFEDDASEILYAMGNAYLYDENYVEACKKYEEAMKRYNQIQKSEWKHPFDNDFRIWARYSCAMIKSLNCQESHNDNLKKLIEESKDEALTIFTKRFKEHKKLWDKWQDNYNVNDEEKKKIIEYLYNEAMLSFFMSDINDAKAQLKKAEEIKLIHYLYELKDKDLDWGLFFKKLD